MHAYYSKIDRLSRSPRHDIYTPSFKLERENSRDAAQQCRRGAFSRAIAFACGRIARIDLRFIRGAWIALAGRALGPRAADNIAAWHTGSESDTVNPLTRLPMYFYSEPSRIIVATYPAVPGIVITRNIALESLRARKAARYVRATHSHARSLALQKTSPLRETSETYIFSLRVKS